MTEFQEANAPFDARRANLVIEHEGTLAQLRARWTELLARDQKAITVNLHTLGIVVVLILLGLGVMMLGIMLRPAVWVGLGFLGLAIYTCYRADRINRRDLLDTRKRKLVSALIEELDGALGPDQSFRLRADFRSPRREATRSVTGDARHWTKALPPSTEPMTHDWFSLSTAPEGRALELRLRSLLGTSIGELRLRDDLELELRGPNAGLAPTLENMEVLASEQQPTHTHLHLRSQRPATRTPQSAIEGTDFGEIVFGVLIMLLRPLLPENWRQWDHSGAAALLEGPRLRELLRVALRHGAERPAARSGVGEVPRCVDA